MPDRRLENSLALIACALIGVVTWLFAHPAARGPGLTWDEAYYYPTFEDVGAWAVQVMRDPNFAFGADGIRSGWSRINELPPVVKWLGALSLSVAPMDGWGRLAAMRLVPSVAYALTLWLLFLLGRRIGGTLAGVLAAGVHAALPTVAGHAQIAATETVFTCVTMLVLWTASGSLLSPWRRLGLCVLLGVALATKVNGIILGGAVGVWLLARRSTSTGRVAMPATSHLAVLGILAASPLVAYAIWPWMWQETGQRLYGYYLFIREHSHQGVWFLGRRWNFGDNPMAPIHYPLVMLLVTTPLFLVALFTFAAGRLLRHCIRTRRGHPIHVLAVLMMVFPVLAASLPTSPKYDGVRLFLPAFAPASLLVGLGVAGYLRRMARRGSDRDRRLLRGGVALFVCLLILFGRQYGSVDYHNISARLLKRDGMFPFEVTYWGNAVDRQVVRDLNELPPRVRVKTLALQTEAFGILRQWGLLRGDIDFDGPPPYDYHLIQNRRGFWGNAEWSIYTMRDPLVVWNFRNGEPAVFLFDGRPPGS